MVNKVEFMLKVILDTNILIDANQDDFSYPKRIIDLCLQKKIKVFLSHKVKRENLLILKRKIKNRKYLQELENFFKNAKITKPEKIERIIKDDPDDDKFLAVAKEVNADYIITSDHHLLDLKKYLNTKIVQPDNFWRVYQDDFGDTKSEWQNWMHGIMRN